MTRKRDLQWELRVFDNVTDKLVERIVLNGFDVRAARKIWSIHGTLDCDDDYFLPDWWLMLVYIVEPAHMNFIRRFTQHTFDWDRFFYNQALCGSKPGEPLIRLKLPRAAWYHMTYKGVVGQKCARSNGGGEVLRWRLEDERILEWDPGAFRADIYSPQGEHLGEFDAVKGKRIGPPEARPWVKW